MGFICLIVGLVVPHATLSLQAGDDGCRQQFALVARRVSIVKPDPRDGIIGGVGWREPKNPRNYNRGGAKGGKKKGGTNG